MDVELLLIPRERIARLQDIAAEAGLAVDAVEISGDAGGARRIALSGAATARAMGMRNAAVALGCAALLLAVTAAALPFLPPQWGLVRARAAGPGPPQNVGAAAAVARPAGGDGWGDQRGARRQLPDRVLAPWRARDPGRAVAVGGQSDRRPVRGTAAPGCDIRRPGRAAGRQQARALHHQSESGQRQPGPGGWPMTLPDGRAGRILALAMAGGLLALAYLSAVRPLVARHGDMREELSDLALQRARLRKIEGELPRLQATIEDMKRRAGEQSRC